MRSTITPDNVPAPVLATMAGVLTAAAAGEEPYPWRLGLGPVGNTEALAWCYTACLLADFIDEIILGTPGEFTSLVQDAGPEEG